MGLLELRRHRLGVQRALDGAEDADRGGAGGALGQVREREGQAGVGVVSVVDEQRVLADVGDVGGRLRRPAPSRTTPRSPSAPNRIGCVLERIWFASRPFARTASKAPSLNTLQFW